MTMRATAAAVAVLVGLTGLTGCGTSGQPSPPSGVDELVIPTPSPEPSDFVSRVDNPWFPLVPGRTATYDVADVVGTHTQTVTVEAGPEIDGVATTARVTTERSARVTDWFAQDTEGNVWWFGRDGVWQAGADGAEAGIAMLATPRVGDGYRTAYEPGTVEDVVTVTAVDPVQTSSRSDLEPGVTHDSTYERGVGLVLDVVVGSGYRTVRLRQG
ncbi:hypothetical protein ABLE68_02785 [Nocardioides sp. CN2-186]|uniref:hypothetical protein n=1 Tax=Nocardioides tweenelious TaxID=3156607 RepID=UPI0032B3671B